MSLCRRLLSRYVCTLSHYVCIISKTEVTQEPSKTAGVDTEVNQANRKSNFKLDVHQAIRTAGVKNTISVDRYANSFESRTGGRRPRKCAIQSVSRSEAILSQKSANSETSDSDSASDESPPEVPQEYVGNKPFTYVNVRRWTKKLRVPLLHHHIILCPINFDQSHWGLHGLFNIFEKTRTRHVTTYMDSLHRSGKTVKKVLQRYHEEEYNDKSHLYQSKSKISRSFQDTPADVPLQLNGFDCGVWVCIFAFCMVHGIDPNKFDGKNQAQQERRTLTFRKHMYVSITGNNIAPIIIYPVGVDY